MKDLVIRVWEWEASFTCSCGARITLNELTHKVKCQCGIEYESTDTINVRVRGDKSGNA